MGADRSKAEGGRAEPGCPRCGSGRVKRIVYGFVDAGEYLELGAGAPDFELGGLEPRAENRCCPRCGHRWAEAGAAA